MRQLWPLLLIAAGCANARAETAAPAPATLSLEQALAEAREHSPELRRAEASAGEASWRPLEAASGNLPRLSASANHYFALKYQLIDVNFGGNPVSFPAIYPKTQLSVNASWTVFDGFATWNSFESARREDEAARRELSRSALELDASVRFKFAQALAARKLAVVADENLRTLQDHERRAQELLKQGEATRFDTLRIETQLSEAQPEKLSADDNAILARRALARAMGLESDERPLEGSLPIPSASAIDAGLTFDVAARDDVQAKLLRAEAAGKARAASQGTWFPRVTFAAEKQFYDSNDFRILESGALRDAYNVGVFLSWNLFDGGASFARQHAAAHRHAEAEAAADALRLQAPEDFELWKRRYLYNVSLYGARTRGIETAEESVRLASLGFKAGTRTSTDVLDAELDLFRARAGAVRAQVDAVEAFLNLELASGRKIGK